jgi:hypothetical protein
VLTDSASKDVADKSGWFQKIITHLEVALTRVDGHDKFVMRGNELKVPCEEPQTRCREPNSDERQNRQNHGQVREPHRQVHGRY